MLNGAQPTLIYGDQRIHADALAHKIDALAASLYQLGVRRGDRIALWLPNCPAWLIAHLAAARLGAATMAVNTRFRSAEVEDILFRSGAKTLVYWPGFLGIDFDAILADVNADALAQVQNVIVYREDDSAIPARVMGKPAAAFDALLNAGPSVALAAPSASDGCILFTTSGTTGVPKLALHTQASIARHADDVAPVFGYDRPDTVLLQALPLCGTFGHAQAMAVLCAGGTLVLMSAFELDSALELMRVHRVSSLNGADTMFEDMWRTGDPSQWQSIRDGGFAAFSTPDPVSFVERADARGVELFGLYGMSEVQALFARQRVGAQADERAEGGGFLTSPDAQFRVCDPDTDKQLEVGMAGELQLRGPSMFSEYFNNPAATAQAMTSDGFLRTGDLARDEGGGRFTYLARMGDSLRLGGFIASPAEIEAYVERDAGVASCQVVGVDGERGTAPVAFVVLHPDADFSEARLRDHCVRGLAKFKVPVRYIPLDAFPMTMSPNGEKIQRVRLREMATAALSAGD
jgi:fatty-acyl-CoA synthase